MTLTFAYPPVLFILVVPALLVAWVWRRQGRNVVLPFDHSGPAGGRGWWVLLSAAETLPALVLAVVILLLAGPQRYGEPQAKRRLTNIELLVDVSGSMTTPFGDGTRYDTSMKAIEEFLNYRKGDAIGLTFFGNNVLHWVPLTSDVSAIRCAPPFMRPEIAPPWMGGTEIGKALRACKQVLTSRQEGDRMIVMVTDGDSFDLWGGNDFVVAKEMKEANIVVYSIHVSDEQIPEQISNITGLTGGEVFAPGDPEGLKAVFQRIDQMQQAPLEKTLAERRDFFLPYCIAGLALIGLGALALFGVRYTPW
jgi:Ca-activated chloride channel family protein